MDDPTLGYRLARQGVNLSSNANSQLFNFRYPLTKLTSSDDYLKIDIVEYIPPGFGNFADDSSSETLALPSSDDVGYIDKLSGDTVNIKGTIILPIPDDVRDSNQASWGISSLNPIQAAAGGAIAGLFDTNAIQKIKEQFRSTAGKIIGAAESGVTQKYLQAIGIEFGLNLLGQGSESANLASRYAGVIANSNIELVFTGVNLRNEFTFSFDMAPRSQKEAIIIREIIRKFKIHSSVKKGKTGENASGLFLKAPEVFRIQYMSGSQPHNYLNKFKICALKQMAVNYTPNGTYATYSDGAPISFQLTLSFQELTPIYAEDYDTTVGSQGVGF